MSRRHHRRCLDTAIGHIIRTQQCARTRAAFIRLVAIASARSDLLAHPPARDGRFVAVDALRNLATFHRSFIGDPTAWPGAHGHPLVVVDSLARHVLARYPTPRFLASVWFGEDAPAARRPRHWFIAHGRGTRFRSLDLPLVMSRKMEHAFLHGPDHLGVIAALRRAQILGLGGSPELAEAVLRTRLGEVIEHEEHVRPLLALLCRDEASLDLADVPAVAAWIGARRRTIPVVTPHGEEQRPVDGATSAPRTIAELVAQAHEWRRRTDGARRRCIAWSPSPWRPLRFEVTLAANVAIRWEIVELVDSHALVEEGWAMRNCVASYARHCIVGRSAIWSLRRHGSGTTQSLMTIEVAPSKGAIVQAKGPANRVPTPRAMELLRLWAERERLELRV